MARRHTIAVAKVFLKNQIERERERERVIPNSSVLEVLQVVSQLKESVQRTWQAVDAWKSRSTSRASLLDKALQDQVHQLVHKLSSQHNRRLQVARRNNHSDISAENRQRGQGHVGKQFGEDVILGKLDMGDGERGEGVMRGDLGCDLFCGMSDVLRFSCSW